MFFSSFLSERDWVVLVLIPSIFGKNFQLAIQRLGIALGHDFQIMDSVSLRTLKFIEIFYFYLTPIVCAYRGIGLCCLNCQIFMCRLVL